MTLPRIGSIPLVDEISDGSSGAAFLLIKPAKSSAVLKFGNASIEIHDGESYVVVRYKSKQDATSVFTSAHSLVQQGLDLMSILGILDSVILDAEDDHILCWTESTGLVVRVVSTTLLEFTIGSVKLVVRDEDGNEVPPMLSNPSHHIAFRYYRHAQTTDDLFNAYRNMYLAFEALLSTHCPKNRGEFEIDWLRRALVSASSTITFNGLGITAGSDIIERILDEIYRDARLPLFHAKEGEAFFAPQDSPTSRAAVSKALGILTQLVLRMAEQWYSARRTGGGVFFGWVYENVRTQLASCSAYINNFDGPFDPTERDLSHPRFKSALRIPCKLAPELQRGDEPAIIASAIGTDFSSVNPIRRIEIATEEHPYLAQVLDAPLHLHNIARFEVLIHIRGTNLKQPRSLFRM
jgi:hypothetical protein